MSSTVTLGLHALLGQVRATQRRLTAMAALRRAARLAPLVLIYVIGALAYVKVADPRAEVVRALWIGLIVLCVLALLDVARIVIRGHSPLQAAVLLDRTFGSLGRVSNAWAFSRNPNPSPLERSAIEDAVQNAQQVRAAGAVPLSVPPEWGVCLVLLGALGTLSRVEVRRERWVTHTPPPAFTPFVLAAEDQSYLDERAAELVASANDPDAAATAHKVQQLLQDLGQGRLERRQVLERLSTLERELDGAGNLDQDALDEGLERLAESLNKNKHTKPIADAIREQRLPDAEKAMRELAERLKKKPTGLSRQELERLRSALKSASQGNKERISRLDAQRQAASATRERLLKKKQEKLSPEDAKANEQALKDNERELKTLDREKQRAERAAAQMSQLDKELAQAAEELMKEMGQAAKNLEAGAKSLNQAARKQLSDQEKQALKKQLQELKEMIRQAKAGSKEHQKQLEKFRKRASGRPGGDGEQPGGQGSPGGQPQVKLGDGQGGAIPIPVPGGGQAAGSGGGQGAGAGNEAGGNVQGDPTKPIGKTVDVAAAGVDSGQGEVSSEVVYGAASRGFAGADYRNVYTEYKTVAEEALASDEIPPGYKFYVRRYFQLIRPRE